MSKTNNTQAQSTESETPTAPAPNDGCIAALEQQLRVSHRRARWWLVLFLVTAIGSGAMIVFNADRHAPAPALPAVPAPAPDTARIAAVEQAAKTARSRELAYRAATQTVLDPELAILLAIEANNAARTSQAEEALRESLLRYPLRTTLRGHKDPVRLWEAHTGRGLAQLGGHEEPVTRAAFSADGQWIGGRFRVPRFEGGVLPLGSVPVIDNLL
jgi:hypothetical protein